MLNLSNQVLEVLPHTQLPPYFYAQYLIEPVKVFFSVLFGGKLFVDQRDGVVCVQAKQELCEVCSKSTLFE